ncbi:MAG: tRNA uridine-5-carboxymethylaminomethyl(34) synthesis GTPase MnmE [Candidatus Omnitrophota bacterium]
MQKQNYIHNTGDTIAAISTAAGPGGIGIVRLSGKKAVQIADKLFISRNKEKLSAKKTHTVSYGHVKNKGKIVDEVVVTLMRAPRSYTTEDIVEINCHGGIVPLRNVLNLAISSGARLAAPGEFTKRAFINGRIDLAQAEAVLDIIKAKTESVAQIAQGQLEGELSGEVKSIKEAMIDVLTEIEAQIDFSEEDIEALPKKSIIKTLEAISKRIKKLIDNASGGIILKEGVLCVICGRPNAGKSSLMNAFLKRNRVIVTPMPGTTRDAIEEAVNLKGIPLVVVDTAGIARAKDAAEIEGMQKSKSYIKKADIILFMIDLSKKWSKIDENIFNSIKEKPIIVIANKNDLQRKLDLKKIKKEKSLNKIIEISLLKKKNIEKCEEAILKTIWRGKTVHSESIFVTNLRHKKELEHAKNSIKMAQAALSEETSFPEIVASFLKEGVVSLGAILGDNLELDILERIFSQFCIGK